MKILFLLTLTLFSFVAERVNSRCKPGFVLAGLSFAHHVYSNYLWFGSIIGFNPRVHILWAIATVIGWVVYGWKCFVTVEYNRLCGLDEDKNHYDLMNAFHRATNISYSSLISILLMLDIVLIFVVD